MYVRYDYFENRAVAHPQRALRDISKAWLQKRLHPELDRSLLLTHFVIFQYKETTLKISENKDMSNNLAKIMPVGSKFHRLVEEVKVRHTVL